MMKVTLLAGGVLVALLAGCAHDDTYRDAAERHRYVAPASTTYVVPSSAPSVVAIERVGADGKVVAIQPRVVNPDGYRVTVRGADGVDRTYIMQSLGDIRVGDRVRVDAGHIYPVG